jgi:CheY-like chemotaxis protein
MATGAANKPKILCVDDEMRVTEAMAALLRREYEVHVATSGDEGLQKLRAVRGLAVVISDMRMPNMDGATFLHEMVKRCPDATRILLTGHAEAEAAKRAVNEGQIFRFLTKPCPPEELRAAVEAGVAHHRLVTAERAVLRETLMGCIRSLTDVLALSNPVAFGRASGIKRLAMQLSAKMGFPEFWQLEAAALLSQLGYMSIPPELAEKVFYARELEPKEGVQVSLAQEMSRKLIERVPRLEPVAQIMATVSSSDEQMAAFGKGPMGVAARVLGIAMEASILLSQGRSREEVLEAVQQRSARYGRDLIGHLETALLALGDDVHTREVPLRELQPGMIVTQEVRNPLGVMLVPRGFEATQHFVDRLEKFPADFLDQKVSVRLAPGLTALPE